MSIGFALLCAAALQAPQDQGPLFATRNAAKAEGEAARIVVSADSRRADCLQALESLTRTMGWNLVVESKPLESDLRFASIDLNLADQDPRMVAQLLAVAAGADTVFAEGAGVEGARPTLHVVRTPSPETEAGRQRLRTLAGQWYRSFLSDELQYEPVIQQEGVKVRMNLGQLLLDSGDLESAISFFTEAYERRPHDQVAAAILKIAECHLDLARGSTDRAVQTKEFAKGEEWARRLLERMPSAPEVTRATVLLGEAMMGQATAETRREIARDLAEKCQTELRARVIRLMESAEMLDVWLLAGQAQFLLEQPDRVYETMLTLRESPNFEDLEPRQFLDYHFLLGYGTLGTKKYDLAMRSLEWFLIHAGADPRRGMAYVLLAESYLAQERFVQARAAAVEARARHIGTMNPEWRQRTLRVWARTALALGEKEKAFLELEQMVLRGEEHELALFLIDEMLADRQWQRAIAVARPLLDLDNRIGDTAKFKTISALFEQAVASRHLDDFPPQAIDLAVRIQDAGLRSQAATMIGDAYTRLGKLEHAADAYRGILR
ncbi:MAG: tetratricopeptide repeat protein [Planctomycetes bacterium]|nr:tetratricopeptide repeat protein [Planctomycetota bacterium]